MRIPSVERPRFWQNPTTKIPAQVPIDAAKSANGVGAESSPPPCTGWSVRTTCPPTCASTRLPPGNVTTISDSPAMDDLRVVTQGSWGTRRWEPRAQMGIL